MPSSTQKNYRVCLTAIDDRVLATKIAETLLQQKLVACVNIINNVSSMYHWQGKIVTDTEWLLVMKTDKLRVERLQAAVLAIHNYEIPEFITLNIEQGHSEYFKWIDKSLSGNI